MKMTYSAPLAQRHLATTPSNLWQTNGVAPGPARAQAWVISFEHVVRSVSTSGRVGLPGYGFQVAHGGQVGQQSLFSM